MNNLFLAQVSHAFTPPTPNGEKKQPPSSAKLSALEEELRRNTMQERTEQTSQAQGTSQQGTDEQRSMIARFDPQNKTFNTYGNVLGDYDTILKQMQTDVTGASTEMELSTLESKKETTRMALDGSHYLMLSHQFGLNANSARVLKKAKKHSRLSADESWM